MKNLLFLLCVLLVACEKAAELPQSPRPVLTMEVGAQSTLSAMALVGEVRPRYESSQGFRVAGKVIERKVDIGAQVKKGQLIARMDAADANLRVAAALADVRVAEASYALAVAEVERQRQLFVKKFISASALDIREAELKSANARLSQVKAQANVFSNQTNYTNLTADRDGVVTMIRAEPGQVVEAGEAVVQIANIKDVEVLVAVPESRMAEVQLNAVATIKMWANLQQSYSGVVREIAPAADSATRTFNVRVSIKNADEPVKLGMTAGVKFAAPTSSHVADLLIPTGALTEINGKKMVWVIDAENKAQLREVQAGQFREDGVLILQGLQAGEKIAIAGVHTLIKNQKVQPVVEASP